MTSLTCVHTLYNNKNKKHLPSTDLSMKPLKDPITLLSHAQFGISYTAPIIVPIIIPSQKPISYPTYVPSSNPTTNQSQVPCKKTSEFQSIVPSLEYYYNNSYIPAQTTFRQGILFHHLHLF